MITIFKPVNFSKRKHIFLTCNTSAEDFILVAILILISGNPYFSNRPYSDYIYLSFGVLLALYSFIRNHIIINKLFTIISILFFSIILIQFIDFQFFPLRTIAGLYVRLFIGFVIVYSVINFPLTFVNVMFYIAIMGLFFHFFHLLNINIEHLLKPFSNPYFTRDLGGQSFFFHTYLPYSEKYRNAGMFWEPGAFAGYLNLSLVFLGTIKESIPKAKFKIFIIIFCVAILSTMSTMGYIILPFSLLLIMRSNLSEVKYKPFVTGKLLLILYLTIPFLLITSVYAYNNIDFLKSKIEKQFRSTEQRNGNWHLTRFGTIIFDWKYISRKPFTGWGANPKTRYTLDPQLIDKNTGMGNGMSDFTAKYGITGFSLFIFYLIVGFKKYFTNSISLGLAVLIIILTLQGECFLNFPLYLGLFFLSTTPPKKIIRKIRW